MKIIADIKLTPFTQEGSTRDEIAVAHEILRDTGLPLRIHAHGTNIEGDYATIVDAVRRIHDALHADGLPRVSTTMTISSRTDRPDSIRRRLEAVGAAPG